MELVDDVIDKTATPHRGPAPFAIHHMHRQGRQFKRLQDPFQSSAVQIAEQRIAQGRRINGRLYRGTTEPRPDLDVVWLALGLKAPLDLVPVSFRGDQLMTLEVLRHIGFTVSGQAGLPQTIERT